MVRTYSIGFLVLAFLAPKYLCFGAGDPNVIVIVSDDAGWADFGFMDSITGENTEIHTPNLDALAARGVKFSNAYTAAVCAVAGHDGYWAVQRTARFLQHSDVSEYIPH